LRFGSSVLLDRGQQLTTVLTGLLYSDVIVDGYIANSSGLPPSVAEVDEGKLRVLGMLQSKLDLPNGLSYYDQVEVRGGEDVIGFGGKLGIRTEW